MHHTSWMVACIFFSQRRRKKTPSPIDLIDTVTLTTTYTIAKLAFDFQ